MSTKINKISAAICSFALMLTSMNSILLQASAGNITDTSWVAGNRYLRPKYDSSSIYVKNISDYYYAYASVYGERDTITPYEEIPVNKYYGTTLTTVNLPIPARSERQIRQFINELTIPFAHIYFTGGGSGVWSPDSVGTYTLAN